MNEPYLTTNITNYETGRPDYLTQLSCPSSEAPMPPLAQEENFYVNNSAEIKNSPSAQDYLSMSPKSGTVRYNTNLAPQKSDHPDSPTTAKNLDFSPKNKSRNTNKRPELPEEIPMLKRNENGVLVPADSDDNGYTEMSFTDGQSNPVTSDAEYKNVFNPNDNYINVPAGKAVANPSYITFNTVNERFN